MKLDLWKWTQLFTSSRDCITIAIPIKDLKTGILRVQSGLHLLPGANAFTN